MTLNGFNEIKKLLESKNDRDKFLWLIENQHTGLILNLDNDDTFLTHNFIDGEYIGFDDYIGCSDGVQQLLDAINIKYEVV